MPLYALLASSASGRQTPPLAAHHGFCIVYATLRRWRAEWLEYRLRCGLGARRRRKLV